jgi:hypothetical protein
LVKPSLFQATTAVCSCWAVKSSMCAGMYTSATAAQRTGAAGRRVDASVRQTRSKERVVVCGAHCFSPTLSSNTHVS